jgi:hypothetical protein
MLVHDALARLPCALVTPEAFEQLKRCLAAWPATGHLAFEFDLPPDGAPAQAVDLSLAIHGGRADRRFLDEVRVGDSELARWLGQLRACSAPWAGAIVDAGFEIDASPRRAPVPNLFVAARDEDALFEAAAALVPGIPDFRGLFPPPHGIRYIGLMLQRPKAGLRLVAFIHPKASLEGLPRRDAVFAAALAAWRPVTHAIQAAFDLDGAGFSPRFGLELILAPGPHKALELTRLLEALMAAKIAVASQRDALLTWPGTSAGGAITRDVLHLKLTYDGPAPQPALKAYLHAYLNTEAPPAHAGAAASGF